MKFLQSHKYLLVAMSIIAICWLYFFFVPVVNQQEGAVYYLKPRISKQTMIKELSDQGIISHPYLFSLYVYMHVGSQLKTGEYFFPRGSSQSSIWKQVRNGMGYYQRQFTIIPGWTVAQIRKALSTSVGLRDLASSMSDAQLMSALGYPDKPAEGAFYPETYNYTRDNPDLSVLKRAAELMENRLNEAWQTRAANLPYKDKYQAIIAASLVEKEAYLATEKPIIAGVLVNRLRMDMLLQFDPTVIYGMGDRYQGKIYKKDLEQDTPYNTYVRKGLPPTAIGVPSMPSIEAALHPAGHDYLYFVARGDGSHQFSKTLSEHKLAVESSRKKAS